MGSQDLIIVFTVVQHLKKVNSIFCLHFIHVSYLFTFFVLFSEKTLHNHVCTNLVDIQSKEGEPLTCAKCDQSFASKR